MIHRSNLEVIVEDWYDIALRMKNDERANKAFGWILEMVRHGPWCLWLAWCQRSVSKGMLVRSEPWLRSSPTQLHLLRLQEVH